MSTPEEDVQDLFSQLRPGAELSEDDASIIVSLLLGKGWQAPEQVKELTTKLRSAPIAPAEPIRDARYRMGAEEFAEYTVGLASAPVPAFSAPDQLELARRIFVLETAMDNIEINANYARQDTINRLGELEERADKNTTRLIQHTAEFIQVRRELAELHDAVHDLASSTCLACPHGCPTCSKDEGSCECYEHGDNHPDNEGTSS